MSHPEQQGDELDLAVSQRLARLRATPVDLTNLDKALKARIPPPLAGQSRWRVPWLLPRRAIAAGIVLVSAIAAVVLFNASTGPVLAEATQMAQVHRQIVSGQVPVMQAGSIDDANRLLNRANPGAPSLPQVPDSHVMACCMKSVHNRKMACVLLKDAGVPVTLAVASAADMKLPPAPVRTRNGVDYRVQQVGDLSMVMTERNDRWLCLIGQTSADRLIELAAQVRF